MLIHEVKLSAGGRAGGRGGEVLPEIFKNKKGDFPYRIYDLTNNSRPDL